MLRILAFVLAGLLTACSDSGDTKVQSSSTPSSGAAKYAKNSSIEIS